MIHFRDFRQECIFRNQDACSYWEKSTECHILACPFHSPETEPKARKALQKQVQDQITFHPEDFDNIGHSVLDVIEYSKLELNTSEESVENPSKKSTVTDMAVSRMQCIACQELITDDKFITIRDPKGVVIYLHSKGKCDPRHDQLKIVRNRWLKVRKHGEPICESQESGT